MKQNTVLTISQPKTLEFRAKAEFTAHGHSEQMGGTCTPRTPPLTAFGLWAFGTLETSTSRLSQ